MAPRLVLASRSPQRRAILEQLGIPFELQPADVEERTDGPPEEVVAENALLKARTAAATALSEQLVLGIDTVVALDGRLYGKPGDADEARSHLAALSGREHEVWSGLVLHEDGRELTGTARTVVHFRALDDDVIDWYLASEEWRDRAGGYAIQGRGAALVQSIDGDYWNVVGLPLALLLQLAPQLLADSRSGHT
jgi:nucleoside triphosphate pyrophosphatase